MEGDEDWVSTSPIKLQAPPARRAFTPGRALSRDEIRQQRRRGPGPATVIDHALARSKSEQGTSTGLFGQEPAGQFSAFKTAERHNVVHHTAGPTTPPGTHRTEQVLHSSPQQARTQTLAGLAHQLQNSPRAVAVAAETDSLEAKQLVKKALAGRATSQAFKKNAKDSSNVNAHTSNTGSSHTVKVTEASPRKDRRNLEEERAIDVTVRVVKENKTYKATYSNISEEALARFPTISPPPDESLFRPTTSPSTSSHAEQSVPSSSRKVVASRLTFNDIDEAEEHGEDLLLSSQHSPPRADHVKEILRSHTPPAARLSEELHTDESRLQLDRSTSKVNKNSARPLKRKSSAHDGLQSAGDAEESLFTEQEEEEEQRSPEPSAKGNKRRKAPPLTERKVEQRKLGNLQSFADWTWPAVQESLKEFSAATPALAKQMRRIETSLSRKFADRMAKIEEINALQNKRKKEVDKAYRIHVERTSLAEGMREEERLWQKSRRNFRINVGLHEAAVQTSAKAAAP